MSIGTTIGRAVGRTAAFTVHAAIKGAHATGQFGADVATSCSQGYTERSLELSAERAAWIEQRKARIEAALRAKAEPVVAVPAPTRTARTARAAAV